MWVWLAPVIVFIVLFICLLCYFKYAIKSLGKEIDEQRERERELHQINLVEINNLNLEMYLKWTMKSFAKEIENLHKIDLVEINNRSLKMHRKWLKRRREK